MSQGSDGCFTFIVRRLQLEGNSRLSRAEFLVCIDVKSAVCIQTCRQLLEAQTASFNTAAMADLVSQGCQAFVAEDFDGAAQLLGSAVATAPTAQAWALKSATMYQLQKYDEAFDDAKKACKSDKTNRFALYRKGYVKYIVPMVLKVEARAGSLPLRLRNLRSHTGRFDKLWRLQVEAST